MRIILYFAIVVYFYFIAQTAEVVTRQIDKHHMFCILFGVVQQAFCFELIGFIVTGSFKGTRYGMHHCFAVLHNKLRFG